MDDCVTVTLEVKVKVAVDDADEDAVTFGSLTESAS